MWNCKFGAKSGGYLRSDPLHCLLITGYQPDTNWMSEMPQASKWLCGISVYFYLFLSASVSFYCFYMFFCLRADHFSCFCELFRYGIHICYGSHCRFLQSVEVHAGSAGQDLGSLLL